MKPKLSYILEVILSILILVFISIYKVSTNKVVLLILIIILYILVLTKCDLM